MSNPEDKLLPEDRVITALQAIKLKIIDLATEIDKQMDYIERHKKNAPM